MGEPERLKAALVALIEEWPFFDNALVRHGFTHYMRDYEIHVIAAATAPDGQRSYQEGRYRFVFTHCVSAVVETAVTDETWRRSWPDEFTDYREWEESGCPEGYVWGVNEMVAYPGARYLPESPRAADWSRRLGRPMHEVSIETNAHDLRLIFHDLRVHRIARGDPDTGVLSPIAPVDLVAPAT